MQLLVLKFGVRKRRQSEMGGRRAGGARGLTFRQRLASLAWGRVRNRPRLPDVWRVRTAPGAAFLPLYRCHGPAPLGCALSPIRINNPKTRFPRFHSRFASRHWQG